MPRAQWRIPIPLIAYSEYEQHGLAALLLEFRREGEDPERDAAEPREDLDILLAAGLERHGWCHETRANIDLPKLLQLHVIVSREGSVHESEYNDDVSHRQLT